MQIHAPGISITSNAGPPLTNLNPEVASARWRAAPLRAGSIDARGAIDAPYDQAHGIQTQLILAFC